MSRPTRLLALLMVVGGLAAAARADEELHQKLLGKAAPEFQADFALNGKAEALDKFRGKVVLLYLWAPRFGGARAGLNKLSEWHDNHFGAGLRIIGVSAYTHEVTKDKIGYRLPKDSQTPEKITDPTRQTEQQLVQELARRAKVNNLMLVQTGEQAKQLRKAYGVSAVPQFVLIDRKGVVRYIAVGEDQAGAVEEQVKKLLPP